MRGLQTLVLQFAVCACCILLLSCKKAQSTEPERDLKGTFVQKIVFDTFSPTGPSINVADLYEDGGVFTLYNKNKLVDPGSTASLAPDGSWLVYMYVSMWPRLMRMNMDGSDQREIVLSQPDCYVNEGRISFDGKSIAVNYQRFEGYDGLHVGVMGINGENFHPIFVDSSQCGPLAWSPDGRVVFQWYDWNNRFAFNPQQSFLARSYICSVKADGTDWRIISDTLSGTSNDKMPSVSPDGKYIAFTSPRSYFPQYLLEEIYVMNIDGSGVRRITQTTFSRNGDHFDWYYSYGAPHWLMDSKHIVFNQETAVYDKLQGQVNVATDLYVVNSDGTDMQRLTTDESSSLLKN